MTRTHIFIFLSSTYEYKMTFRAIRAWPWRENAPHFLNWLFNRRTCFCISLTFGLATGCVQTRRALKVNALTEQRDLIEKRNSDFYNPIIGNRIIYQSRINGTTTVRDIQNCTINEFSN